MTRDEAIKAFDQNTNIHDRSDTPRWIARFVALGLLELDGDMPSGQIFKVRKLMSDLGLGHMSPAQFEVALKRRGLKISEA